MKRLLQLLPLLLLAACEPAEPTTAQVADRLQVQINELLEEVDKSLEKVADLDLDGLCANSGRITAGMDLLVPRYHICSPDGGTRRYAASITGRGEQPISSQWMSKKSDATAPQGSRPLHLNLSPL